MIRMCFVSLRRVCLGCGKEYVAKRKDSISCSKSCASLARSKKTLEYKKEWKKLNPQKVLDSNKKYYHTHKEKLKIQNNIWRKDHLSYFSLYSSLYNKRVKCAQPLWANVDDILSVYQEAKYMGLEVDHEIPLNHPLVCGLHVWDNLQLLSRSENASKSNRFVIE